MRLISQLINDISRILQKSQRFFNGTIISTTFLHPSPVLPVIFCLNKTLLLLSEKSTTEPALFKDCSSL